MTELDHYAEFLMLADAHMQEAERLVHELLMRRTDIEILYLEAQESVREILKQARKSLPEFESPPGALSVLCDGRVALPAVYGLVSRDEPERVRYVGQSRTPAQRYVGHTTARAAVQVLNWTKCLAEPPVMVLIENCNPMELVDREAYWIAFYRNLGMADLNTSVKG